MAETYQDHLQRLPLDLMLSQRVFDGLNCGALKQRDILELSQLLCAHVLHSIQGMLCGAHQHNLILLIYCLLQHPTDFVQCKS